MAYPSPARPEITNQTSVADVSIVIPTKNEAEQISGCLESCIGQTVLPREIIVVDNNSTDGTRDIVKDFYRDNPSVPLRLLGIEEHIDMSGQASNLLNIAVARSKGFDAATGSLLGRTDADARLKEDWVETAIRAFTQDPKLVAIGGLSAIRGMSPPGKFWGKKLSAWKHEQERQKFYVEHLYGHNLVLRADVWNKSKPHLLNYTMQMGKETFEDFDLSYALARLGKTAIVDELIVKIAIGRSLDYQKRKRYWLEKRNTRNRHMRGDTPAGSLYRESVGL